MADNVVIADREPAKLNLSKVLMYVDLGVELAKTASEAIKKINAVTQSEKLTKIVDAIDKGLNVADKVLENKALIELLLALFGAKTENERTAALMNFMTGS